MNRRICSLFWKTAIIFFECWGLSLSFELFSEKIRWIMLNYFTNLSNLLALAYFVVAVVVLFRHPDHPPTVCPLWKGVVTMGLTLTMLVAHFMLGGSHSPALFLLHVICPLMTLADWLLFDEKGLIRKISPLLWTVPPLIYLAYAMLAARIGDGIGTDGRYPYPFMDVDARGGLAVAVTVVEMLLLFVLLGYVFYFIDHVAAKLHRKKVGA